MITRVDNSLGRFPCYSARSPSRKKERRKKKKRARGNRGGQAESKWKEEKKRRKKRSVGAGDWVCRPTCWTNVSLNYFLSSVQTSSREVFRVTVPVVGLSDNECIVSAKDDPKFVCVAVRRDHVMSTNPHEGQT